MEDQILHMESTPIVRCSPQGIWEGRTPRHADQVERNVSIVRGYPFPSNPATTVLYCTVPSLVTNSTRLVSYSTVHKNILYPVYTSRGYPPLLSRKGLRYSSGSSYCKTYLLTLTRGPRHFQVCDIYYHFLY